MSARGPFPLDGRRVWVAGHRGMVGAAVVRRLAEEPCEVLTAGRATSETGRHPGSPASAIQRGDRPGRAP